VPGTDEKTARAPRRLGGILRQRDFRLFWIGESVSGAGNSMAAIGVPLLAIATLHASTFAVTVLTAAAYLPWLVIGLPAGAWADRLPSRPLMIACDLISAALYASLPLAAWLGVLTIWQTLLVALLAGSANVFFATAYQVYLPSLAADGDLIEGNAKLQGSATVASIGGRGAAGLAAQAVGNATALLFNAASFGVSAACLLAGPRASCCSPPPSGPAGISPRDRTGNDPGNDQRSVRKNARMSPVSRSGTSMAAKCPPRSNSDQCVMLLSRSANRRMAGAISRGKTATPVGTSERAAGFHARACRVS